MKRNTNLVYIVAFALLLLPALTQANNTDKKEESNKQVKTTAVEVEVENDDAATVVVSANSNSTTSTTTDDEDEDEDENDDNATSTDDGDENEGEKRAEERRSRVAEAVQEMVQAADRVGGVGEQVRVIAQEQGEAQKEIEADLKEVTDRSKLLKFLIGPNYSKVIEIEDKLNTYEAKLDALKNEKKNITSTSVTAVIDAQIAVMEAVKNEISTEVASSTEGFSLFGWLNKIFSR